MRDRITTKDVEDAAKNLKQKRIDAGKKTWLSVEYYNGYCHLHEVDQDYENRHCSLRKIAGGTKREMHQYLQAASF